ncbi:hypothetical protein [uncultured Gammaproteobacteria bacterium]|nr:hypothetical protein [uncultured Gammaproteobacteria bacterium]
MAMSCALALFFSIPILNNKRICICSTLIEFAQNLTTQWLWIDNHKRAHFPLGGILPRAKMG